jgi:integrase
MNIRFLFTLPNGSFISTSTINSHFKKIAKDCGIRSTIRKRKGKNGTIINENTSTVTTHMLRHTFITRCVEQGMAPKALQTLVGHSNYSITANIYTQIDEEFKISEMKKVEEQLKASNLM